jgi:ribose/xylose/arabinose/galactoside ABC-type transport system permease subunit
MLIAAMAFANPVFLTPANLTNILLQSVVIGIISLGMTVLIVIGAIDLSVGAVAALAAIVLARFYSAGCPAVASVGIALLVGACCGLVSGLLAAKCGVPAFIATLSIMGIARGLALVVSEGRSIREVGELASFLGSGSILAVPVPILLFLVLAVVAHVFMGHTTWGLRTYAIGSNRMAAWVSGISIEGHLIAAFVTSGLLSALAGVVVAGRLSSAQPVVGALYELDAITAVVLGGGSLSGGRGSVAGTTVGVLILGAVRNGMVLMDVSPYYHQIVLGLLLAGAVVLDRYTRNRRGDIGGQID